MASLLKFPKTAAALLLVLLIASVWWARRPPREPRYGGRPLSAWLLLGTSNPNWERLDRSALQSLGPDAVKWLAYQARRARIWNPEELAPDAPPWQRAELWLRSKITRDRTSKSDYLHFESIVALGELGPDAAPAVPALIKAVRDGDNDDRLLAAESLARIGPAAWPAVAEALRNGTPRQRRVLFDKLDHWFDEFEPPTSAAPYVEVLKLLAAIIYDPDELFHNWSLHHLEECGKALRNSPHFEAGLQTLIETLPDIEQRERHVLIGLLGTYDADAAAAIPALTALASDADLLTRAHALGALATIDRNEPRWPALLYEIRRTATGKPAEAADWALNRAGR